MDFEALIKIPHNTFQQGLSLLIEDLLIRQERSEGYAKTDAEWLFEFSTLSVRSSRRAGHSTAPYLVLHRFFPEFSIIQDPDDTEYLDETGVPVSDPKFKILDIMDVVEGRIDLRKCHRCMVVQRSQWYYPSLERELPKWSINGARQLLLLLE